MITVSQIRNGAGYLSRHLSANDYYSEGERVEGYWLGKGAERLGLAGKVKEAEFEALRQNRHPFSGEKLTPRQHKVAFHDIVLSAPKSFSIAAMVGQDERLVMAFHESSRMILGELEKHAAVRVRAGEMVKTEALKTTGNVACAVFHHDSSRMLGPQLHTHLVIANVSFDDQPQRWMALQPKVMLEASKQSIRAMFHEDLAQRAENLGYKIAMVKGSFRIDGVSQELEERFSQRSGQRRAFEQRYLELFQKEPSKQRIEHFIKEGKSAAKARFVSEFERAFHRRPSGAEVENFVKDWRSSKLKKATSAEVRRNQLNQLSPTEREILKAAVANARKRSMAQQPPSLIEPFKQHIPIEEESRKKLIRETKGEAIRQRSGESPSLQPVKRQKADHANAIRKQRLLRQMKRGLQVGQALRGRPAAIIAGNLRTASRR